MIKASLLSRVGSTVAAVVLLPAAPALAAGSSATARAAARTGAAAAESTPVDLTGASNAGASHVGGGGSIVRTIVGLAIVIGVIYGVAWVLRQVKASRQPRATGSGLATLASVPLGSGRAVHLVRAGRDLVLLGVAEHGVVPIRTYSEEEAHAAGLIDDDGMLILPADESERAGGRGRRPRLALPKLALPSAARLQLPQATRTATGEAAPAKAAAPRPKLAPGGRGPSPRSALDTLRAWTVRS
ncbi:MAG TPA: flagellar biosynthetic protein FliO [Conexibacter sp.]|jgi:flagellar protein FliO/FliZ|nr:flagellar biosynthetic protein FliO [Conexibacter sp.]